MKVLPLIGLLLVASIGTRGWDLIGPALAIEPAPEQAVAPDPKAAELLVMIKAKAAELEAREERLREREILVDLSEQDLRKSIAELRTADEQLRETIALSETASSDDIALLTKVYQQMKPQKAAAVFEQMTPEFAAGFLGNMKADSAAAILAFLPPENAYSISVLLAGRNARAPGE